jgi:hypothetical protein
MPYYYVMRPGFQTSAMVQAPSTEKARTTFLDYLERHNIVSRASRQSMRRNMVAKRVDDPNEVETDIQLQYGYENTSGGELPLEASIDSTPVSEDLPMDVPVNESLDSQPAEPLPQPEQPVQGRKLSPIQKLSLGVR